MAMSRTAPLQIPAFAPFVRLPFELGVTVVVVVVAIDGSEIVEDRAEFGGTTVDISWTIAGGIVTVVKMGRNGDSYGSNEKLRMNSVGGDF